MNKFLVGSAVLLLGAGAPAHAADWDGFYAGINAGYAEGQSGAKTSTVYSGGGYFTATSVPAIATTGAQNLNNGGFTGGAQGGFNAQSGNLVYGAELDIDGLDLRDSKKSTTTYPCCSPSTFTISQSRKTDWLVTARPRLGWLSGDLLFYGTAGLAITKLGYKEKFTDTFGPALETANMDKTRLGWTAGGGLEAPIADQWTVKGEYLFADFGHVSTTSTNLIAYVPAVAYPQNVFTHRVGLEAHIFRVGANYHF
ncbi:MAG TPA: outer membrane beta-barrel protein [Micropepsaceae bacterium]|nr:outer membrane beta-barrel protein [Micropepsaceae bacterium]